MVPGEQITGTRDEHYSLVSVLYRALHAAEAMEAYILDAEAVYDERLASFFRVAQAMQRRLAERAKGMLGILEVPPELVSRRTCLRRAASLPAKYPGASRRREWSHPREGPGRTRG
jgi:hypothetical protein